TRADLIYRPAWFLLLLVAREIPGFSITRVATEQSVTNSIRRRGRAREWESGPARDGKWPMANPPPWVIEQHGPSKPSSSGSIPSPFSVDGKAASPEIRPRPQELGRLRRDQGSRDGGPAGRSGFAAGLTR